MRRSARVRPLGNPKPFYASWAAATAWPRPPFSPLRTISFTDAAGLASALSGMQSGDLIQYTGTGALSISGEYTGFAGHSPASRVVVDLGLKRSGNYVHFTGVGAGVNLPAVWVHDVRNVTIYGGDISSLGSGGVLVHGGASMATDSFIWWDFVIHDVGGNGLAVEPTKPAGGGSTISNCSFKGEIYNWGQDLSFDGHAEHGTGLHGCITADTVSAGQGGVTTGNTWALWCHDGPSGAAFEMGQDTAGSPLGSISGNVLYLLAQNLTYTATSQSAGNGVNLWGGVPIGLTIEYLEVRNAQGRSVNCHGLYGSTGVVDGGKVTVKHQRCSSVCLNATQVANESADGDGTNPWALYGGVTYQDSIQTTAGF